MTINAFIRNIKYIIDKQIVESGSENSEDAFKKISNQIIHDFTDQENKDEDLKSIILDIRNEVDISQFISKSTIESRTDRDPIDVDLNSLEFCAQFELRIVSLALIYDSSNNHRNYDRIFDSYLQLDTQNALGIKDQMLVSIAGSHFLICSRNIKLSANFSSSIDAKFEVNQISVYDYNLVNHKLPVLNDGKDNSKSKDAEVLLKESISNAKLKRSFISRLSKRSIYKSNIKSNSKIINASISSSANDIFYDTNDNDDELSFKSFAENIFPNKQDEVESSIAESQFIDAHDTDDIWFINPLIQHFSIIPIFTMNTFKSISKSVVPNNESKIMTSSTFNTHDIKTSISNSIKQIYNRKFQFTHQLIDKENFDWFLDSNSSSDDEEKPVKLDCSSDSINSLNPELTGVENAIQVNFIVNKSFPRQDRPTMYLIDIEIETQNIFIELVPTSIVGISNIISPFEYFYYSAIDTNLKNYSQFISDTYSIPILPPKVEVVQNKKSNIIIGDIKLSKIPYLGWLIYFINPETKYFQEVYRNHIGEYMSQNHFLCESDYIIYSAASNQEYSYSYDMIQKQLHICGHKELSQSQRLLYKLSAYWEIFDIEAYIEPNTNEISVDLGSTQISIVNDTKKEPIAKFDKVIIDNLLVAELQRKEDQSEKININTDQTYFYSDPSRRINEACSDEEDDTENTQREDFKLIFGKNWQSEHQHNSNHAKPKKNYFHIDFSRQAKICCTHSDLNNLTSLMNVAMDSLNSIKAIFYVARSWTMEISGNTKHISNIESSWKDSTVSYPEDIDDYLEQISSSNCEELDRAHYKSSMKVDLTINQLYFSLVDEIEHYNEFEVQPTKDLEETKQEFNPFVTTFEERKEPEKTKDNLVVNHKFSSYKLALISILAEGFRFKFNIHEDIETK